jgi:hypothetical protein
MVLKAGMPMLLMLAVNTPETLPPDGTDKILLRSPQISYRLGCRGHSWLLYQTFSRIWDPTLLRNPSGSFNIDAFLSATIWAPRIAPGQVVPNNNILTQVPVLVKHIYALVPGCPSSTNFSRAWLVLFALVLTTNCAAPLDTLRL